MEDKYFVLLQSVSLVFVLDTHKSKFLFGSSYTILDIKDTSW